MLRYIFSLLLLCAASFGYAQDDEPVRNKQLDSTHQIRIGFDVAKLPQNQLFQDRTAWDLSIDYYHRKELYWVAEAGWGNSQIAYPDLQYKSDNSFARLGVEKSLFTRRHARDWGNGFFGGRYAMALVNRSEAQFTTNDGFGGITSGTVAAQNITLHWFELVGGMKIELYRGLFAGWTVRAKFLMNPKAMGDLKPNFIAGYGLGEKATVFDYNFYLAYAMRWSRKFR